ncbi:BRO-N domain-containing protein [Embleya sp. NPDC001921]
MRVAMIAGDPWFRAADVCTVPAFQSDSRRAVSALDPDEKTTVVVHKTAVQEGCVKNPYGTGRGNPNMTFVSESGLYTLILRSNKPEAKPFRRRVTHDVLPTIRRTGRYTPPPAKTWMRCSPAHSVRSPISPPAPVI